MMLRASIFEIAEVSRLSPWSCEQSSLSAFERADWKRDEIHPSIDPQRDSIFDETMLGRHYAWVFRARRTYL